MSKAQAAALLLTGATLGVGGKALVGNFTAEAKSIPPYSHAVDLRRQAPDAGVTALVYGTRQTADGGVQDVGQARSCKPDKKVLDTCARCMNGLADDCAW